jgi:hypothetical protein
MLLKRHCPHTGIVNFFSTAEPHLPVGFIYATSARNGFTWRCHTGAEDAAGQAVDLQTAEANLSSYYIEHNDGEHADGGQPSQRFSRRH